jgi:hypothetical protein
MSQLKHYQCQAFYGYAHALFFGLLHDTLLVTCRRLAGCVPPCSAALASPLLTHFLN